MKNGTKHRGAPLLVATAVLAGLILILGSGPVWANGGCIDIEKLVSVDGGYNFEDADDCANAPTANSDAEYKLVVTNCGAIKLFHVTIKDEKLGINKDIGDLGKGKSKTFTYLDDGFDKLYQQGICPNGPEVRNLVKVSAQNAKGVEYFGEDPACVKCEERCSIGDYVWEDANGNGCQDDEEKGIKGVTVRLFDGCFGNKIATTKTDDNGFYKFDNLVCGKEYGIKFVNNFEIYAQTDPNSCLDNNGNNDDTKDSDCGNGGKVCATAGIDSRPGTINPTIDCGYVCGGKIGDRVWLDESKNGCQDAPQIEPGIPGVPVTLSEDCGDPKELTTILTDENGDYAFTGLCPGEYFVEFGGDLPNTDPGQLCGDNSEEKDSNCGNDNLQCVTLTRDNFEDPTIDCGKIPPPCELEVTKVADPDKIVCDSGTDGVDTGTDGDCIVICDSGTDGLCIAETVTYTITVTNPSNRIVENIMVDDEVLGFTEGPFTLGPGQSKKFTLPGVCVKEDTKNTVVVTVDGELCDEAMAEVTVDPICPDDSAVTAAPTIDLSDNKKVKWELTNNGPFDVFITKVVVTWPDAADEHDMLKKFKLDGDFAKDFLDGDSPTIVPLEKAFEDDADKRRLEAGKSEELEIEFEEEFDNKADRGPEDFSIYVLFDTGQVVTFNLP